jgi:predicted ester cyclase
MIAEWNMVAARFTAKGTPQEEWSGVPLSGNKFESGGIFILRIENGKVVEQWEDFDLFGTFMQLGMELKPGEKKK